MTPNYQLAAEKFRFLVNLWLHEDCGCSCSQCEELLEEAEKLMKDAANAR